MRILIAPNSFKNALSTFEVIEAIEVGLSTFPQVTYRSLPIADGGDHTTEVLVHHLQGQWHEFDTVDPFHRPIKAKVGWVPTTKIAIISISSASGISLIDSNELDPFQASTYGTGILIRKALELNPTEIWIGLGGSATIDGGLGALSALDVISAKSPSEFLEKSAIESFHAEKSDFIRRLGSIPIKFITDVKNPLLGVKGAIEVFGAQKGLRKKDEPRMEAYMQQWFNLVNDKLGKVNHQQEGLGAAGGFALPFVAMGNASIHDGFDFIAKKIGLEEHIRWSDFVITGEGSIDAQSLDGKGPVALARLAKKHGKRTIGLTGKWNDDDRSQLETVFWKIAPISPIPKKLSQALAECREDIISTIKTLMMEVSTDY